jgi:hypothetical protein
MRSLSETDRASVKRRFAVTFMRALSETDHASVKKRFA